MAAAAAVVVVVAVAVAVAVVRLVIVSNKKHEIHYCQTDNNKQIDGA